MSKLISYIFIGLLVYSCASQKDQLFEDKSSDLVKEFNIKPEQLEKFKVVKSVSVPPVATKELEKSKKKKGITQKKIPSKKKVAKKSPKLVEKEKPEEIKGFSYPGDFPVLFKKYDKVSKKLWKDFNPKVFQGEEFVYELSYMGITAGFIKMESGPKVLIGEEEAFLLKAHLRSARYYKYIYELDDTIESFVSTTNFLPIKYSLFQRESGQEVDDLQLFDQEALKTYFWYKRLKKGKLKRDEKTNYIPRFFQDSYSALYFVRGLPLEKGRKYQLPIVTRGKTWLLTFEVKGIETISHGDKETKAIKIAAETHFPGVLKKSGDIIFWYSADEFRRLVRFEAKVKIGKVKGELVEYKQGTVTKANTQSYKRFDHPFK